MSKQFTWSNAPELLRPGYEVSTAGDKRFSALNARLPGSRESIEHIYQLDCKGYRKHGNDWRLGKGKGPLLDKDHTRLWSEYLNLWRRWASRNKPLMDELREKAAERGYHLTDSFARTRINQARALCTILNETERQNAS